ncbi:hypothetical protein [Hymenobacter antarcticus]|uniref:hypothetical protein n=1 Tax=Hymenobacter antarcticus TaxID=486270 RepID=UPI0031E633A2
MSKKTHYSPTDPDARISVKPDKARALNYLCSLAVDTASGVISYVQADLTDGRDSLHLPRLLRGLQRRFRATNCPGAHCWPMRATPTGRITPCSKPHR